MFYQIQIFLIVALLLLGTYELFQLTKLGRASVSYMRFFITRFNGLFSVKKSWKNKYHLN